MGSATSDTSELRADTQTQVDNNTGTANIEISATNNTEDGEQLSTKTESEDQISNQDTLAVKSKPAKHVETGALVRSYTSVEAQLIATLEDQPTSIVALTPRPSLKYSDETAIRSLQTQGQATMQQPSTSAFTSQKHTFEEQTMELELIQLQMKHQERHKYSIILASFMIHFVMTGFLQSFGVWFVAYIAYFHDRKWKTSMIGSVTSGMNLFVGPIASALCSKFGYRIVCISGSVAVTTSLLLSTLAPSVDVLIVTCGVMAGTGLGMMYLPSIVIIGDYFEKRRALATGLAMCGSGIGSFVFAPLSSHLISTYGWKDGMKVIACILLAGVPMGAFFVSANKTPKPKKKEPRWKKPLYKLGLRRKSKKQPTPSATIEENSKEPPREQMSRLSIPLQRRVSLFETESMFDCDDLLEKVPTREELDKVILAATHDISSVFVADGILSEVYSLHEKASHILDEVIQSQRTSIYGGTSILLLPTLTEGREVSPEDGADIQARTSGMVSLANVKLRERASQIRDKPPATSRMQKHLNRVVATLKALNKAAGFSVLKHPKFLMYGVSCFSYTLGLFVPLYYITSQAEELEIKGTESSLLLSIIGISNTVSRIFIGWVADKKWVGCVTLHVVALLIAGMITALLPLYKSYTLLACYSALFGCCMATFISLRSIIVIELMGITKLTKAFGVLGMLQGIASFTGPPIAGFFYDLTGNYTVTFISSGSTFILAGVLSVPLVFLVKRQNMKEEQEKRLREKLEILSKMSQETLCNVPTG